MELKELCLLRGISGDESEIRNYIKKECLKYTENVRIGRGGCLIAEIRGRKNPQKRVMLSAHMDEVGFAVTSACEDGLLRITAVGGIDSRVSVSKRVLVGSRALPGVIGAMPIHLQSPEDRMRVMRLSDLFVDIGESTKAGAEKAAPINSSVTFDTPYTEFGAGFVCCKALDDRVGCYNMLRLMEKAPFDDTVIFVFTSMEEVGLLGARTAAYDVDPDEAIVLETTAANDIGMVDETKQVCRAGKGVALSFMDRRTITPRALFEHALSVAEKNGIALQVKSGTTGGNDAGAVHTSRRGIPTITLSVPCRNIHSPASVCALSDIEAQYHEAEALISNTDWRN
ncbi:MAG: M28 family peptidase [Eubacteriales bacterium]|nr:M28 family peptidase [Eubacteriales bacterium]MDD3880877.1 M28 family peptidase [Eubacteriales bacterium]MDD4511756.1 M28 family peptidase [Eubacteriales bacterium]